MGDTTEIVNIFVAFEGGKLGEKTNFRIKVSQCRKTETGGLFGVFKHPICCETSKKLKGDPLERKKVSEKISQCRKKIKGGTLWDFPISNLSQNSKKSEGVGKKIFRKKSLAVPKKNWKGDPLVSPGLVCYAGKQEKPFWFGSVDQIVQFGAIIFCRTFKNYFGQFVWIKKKKSHYNSRVSLHEAPTKKSGIYQSFNPRPTKKVRYRIERPTLYIELNINWRFLFTNSINHLNKTGRLKSALN